MFVSRAGSLPLVGGDLALDLTNTSSGRGTALYLDHLRTSADALTWLRHAKVVDATQIGELERRCAVDEALAERLLARLLGLREALFRIWNAGATSGQFPDGDVAELARVHAACLGVARLVAQDEAFVWRWNAGATPIEAVLGPIALSGLTLLLRADRSRVKRCCGANCGWLFLDRTKNGGRRWCEMEVCGNRAKQRRLQTRKTRAKDAPG